ncbi:hypothetical protein FRX31_025437 [Thalictrum thalictroides]|uniref:Uncharacterized protein n=1 Tax=Thalictrum thalictroides TaxID=46969 RepID=A0A7J6VIN5_THATH|nr:hypothetical protein FRX31_025437 [Thalictrum thalictroides]
MVSMENVGENIHEGDVLGGQITKVLPGLSALFVQIGPHLYRKAHYTELADEWLDFFGDGVQRRETNFWDLIPTCDSMGNFESGIESNV